MFATRSPAANAGHPIGIPATYPPPVLLTGQGRDGSEMAAQVVGLIDRLTARRNALAAIPDIFKAMISRLIERKSWSLDREVWSAATYMTDAEVATLLPVLLEYPSSCLEHPHEEVRDYMRRSIDDLKARAAAAKGVQP